MLLILSRLGAVHRSAARTTHIDVLGTKITLAESALQEEPEGLMWCQAHLWFNTQIYGCLKKQSLPCPGWTAADNYSKDRSPFSFSGSDGGDQLGSGRSWCARLELSRDLGCSGCSPGQHGPLNDRTASTYLVDGWKESGFGACYSNFRIALMPCVSVINHSRASSKDASHHP